jgi:membrane protein YdbS with pleckstrin-like domain
MRDLRKLKTHKEITDLIVGLLIVVSIGTIIYLIWSDDWRPAVTSVVVTLAGYIYSHQVDEDYERAARLAKRNPNAP